MAVYTCLDMVRDCRAGQPEGWNHFISEYLPFCRAVIEHYLPQRASDPDILQTILAIAARPECPIFDVSGTTPEREFLLNLRTLVVEQVQTEPPGTAEPALENLAELSPLERQLAWLETLRNDDSATARMVNIDLKTVTAARAKGHAALEGGELAGIRLPEVSPNCAPPRLLADYMDGRVTWTRREELDRHLNQCWRCIDLFCRVRESDYLMRRRRPLEAEEIDRFRRALGVEPPRTSFWQKVLSVGWN